MSTSQNVSAPNNNVAQRLALAEAAIGEMEPSYRVMQGLQSIGHFIGAVVTGAKVVDGNLWGYEMAPDSLSRIALAGAAIDEMIDSGKSAFNVVKGLDPKALEAKVSESLPELTDAEVSKLPTEVQTGYRALQAARSAGRLVSAALIMDATISGDYGVLGQTNDSLIRLGTAVASVQQAGEGVNFARDAIRGA